ncbi:MAG: ATP-binding protein [Bacteroidales bacterium]|nr:ATP-binding protein [Bacteroidales bacterium]
MRKRAYSVKNVMDAKFRTLPFDGEWLSAVGTPELTGSWMIYGAPKNGKTTFAMMLAKYLTRFGRVAYDSVEEGLSQTIKMAMERVGMEEVGHRLILLDKEGVDELAERLARRKSPGIVVIDSVQFLGLNFSQYKRLKEQFPDKLFVYISHVDGRKPEGSTAQSIWRDANVYFNVEGYRAFPVGRYGGGKYIDVWPEQAAEYWGFENT